MDKIQSLLTISVGDFINLDENKKQVVIAALDHIKPNFGINGVLIDIYDDNFTIAIADCVRSCVGVAKTIEKQCQLVDFILGLKKGVAISWPIYDLACGIKYLATVLEDMNKFAESLPVFNQSSYSYSYCYDHLNVYNLHNLVHKLAIAYHTTPVEVAKWPWANSLMYSNYLDAYDIAVENVRKAVSEKN